MPYFAYCIVRWSHTLNLSELWLWHSTLQTMLVLALALFLQIPQIRRLPKTKNVTLVPF